MRRQGNLLEAARNIEKSLELDPRIRTDDLFADATWVELCDRKFDDAMRFVDRASQPLLVGQDFVESFPFWRGLALSGKGEARWWGRIV